MKSGGYRPLVACVPPTKPVPCPVLRLEDLGFEVGMFSLDQVDVGAWRTRSRPPDLIELAGQGLPNLRRWQLGAAARCPP